MRVIAGLAKGRTLKLDRKAGIRPTSDRLKEALFGTLGDIVEDARVLDLFAGSGALGIEALSRGAAHATFVDSERGSIAMIRANLESTGLGEQAEVVHQSAERFVAGGRGGPFDLVVMDPPYTTGIPPGLLAGLGPLLAPGARLAIEVATRSPAIEVPAGYLVQQERRYGDSTLLYLTFREGG